MLTRNVKSYISYILIIAGLSVCAAGYAAAGTGSKISVSSGGGQTALVGTTLPSPFVVLVTDSSGNPLTGAPVNWAIQTGGGSLASASTTTNASGLASNTLTLGTVVGNNKAIATTATGAAAIFGAVGTAGPPVSIGLSSGNGQSGTVGTALPNSLAVIIQDQYGNAALNTEVDWAVLSGGGSVPYAYSLSKAGIATKVLTLGAKPGVNTASATIHGTSLSYVFSETGTPGTLPTGPPVAISVSSGSSQTQQVGTTLSSPFVALVTDSNGTPVPNATVNWSVMTGGGTLASASTTTNASGLASDTLTLGTVTGSNKVSAVNAANGTTALFGAVGTPGPPVSIGASSGNGQTGPVGVALPNSLAVIITDQYGNGATSSEVDWTVTSGGGSVPYTYSLSSGGIATKVLTLGTVPGVNQATATVAGTSLSFTFTETAVPGPVSALVISSGNDQEGSAAGPLANPLTVEATDSYGNAVTGTKVDWTPNTAGDSFSVASSITNASGLASSALTLGSTFGLHNATATVDGTTISQPFVATEGVAAVVTSSLATSSSPIVPPNFMGLSYSKESITIPLFNAQNSSLVGLFKALGPGVLRIIAERPLNPVLWNPSGPGLVSGTVAPPDIARLAAFVKAANWKILYGIALVNNTPAQAASEAAVVAQAFGSSLLGFEIGNEPIQYANAVYGNPPTAQIPNYTWQDYISTTPVYDSNGNLLPSWPAFASAIQAAVAGAPLTGPTDSFAWAMNFAVSSQAPITSLLTRHYYRLPPPTSPTPTIEDVLATDPTVAVQFPQLAQAAASADIEGGYRISECNSIAGDPDIPGVTNGFGVALWAIDFIFQNAVYQSTGVNFNGGGSDTVGYSPIFDDGTNVLGLGPDYYGLYASYYLLKAGTQLLSTQVTPSPSTFSAYAVQQANGTTNFILSNKDPNNSITVSVARHGSSTGATSLLLTAPSLNATSEFELGGNPIQNNGSWSASSNPTLTMVGTAAVVTIPPGSAQLIHMK